MNCLVTGAVGFIGSHLCERLLKDGHKIRKIDMKLGMDLNNIDLKRFLGGIDCVFHLAATAGVRSSWGKNFPDYTRNNIEATQKLLEACKDNKIQRIVYASSCSVYGNCQDLPMSEESPLRPYSPYGVTKLAGENLCRLYFSNYKIPVISLRFFTVYGSRQRSDMAFHRFFKSIIEDKKIVVYGDGKQTRDFTYIDDVITAFILAINKGNDGEAYNVGSGMRIKLRDIFPIMEDVCKKKIRVKYIDKQQGDMIHTIADIRKARETFDYEPKTKIEDGLREEWRWIQGFYKSKR